MGKFALGSFSGSLYSTAPVREAKKDLLGRSWVKLNDYLFPFTPRTIREANISALVSASAQKI